MKIAVIGGSGFIGTHLVGELLAAGHDVIIGDTTPNPHYPDLCREADIRDVAALERVCAGCDVIYNLAAEHRDDVTPLSLYHDVNVVGSENICEAAENLGITRIIFTSSVAIYGFSDGKPNEQSDHVPFNEYGRTKSAAEDIYTSWQNDDKRHRSLTIIRPTAVFGPGNRGNVYNLIKQIASGRFVMIGNGKNQKSLACVENVSGFLAYALQFESGTHIYNYVDKPDFTMKELVSLIRKTLGKGSGTGPALPYGAGLVAGGSFDILATLTRRKFPISKIRVEKFCANTVYSSQRMQNTDFRPKVTLRDALVRMIEVEFLGKNGNTPSKEEHQEAA